MQDIGQLLLFISFFVTAATALTAFAGAMTRNARLIAGARSGLYAATLIHVAMAVILTHGFLTHEFANKYIATYSDRSMPTIYLLASFWGGEKGALLFWVTSLSVFASIAVFTKRERSPVYLSYVVGILAIAVLFFQMLMVFESSPFETFITSATGPDDGRGLNPLLQNPVMAFHPPSLLTGYILFTIPFAFGMAALITNKLDEQWIADTRRWTIVSWTFLTIGLLLGARWAYMEIGWGFWWMWDPVENAGFIPWFTATAFLHSVMIQERRGMLKRWNVILLALTFLLTIFGTFLTRSQLIVSIHAFADSKLPNYFFGYMLVIAATAFGLIAWRWRALRSEARIESFMSRESMFVLNNVILVFGAFVVLWGTLFAKITESESVRDAFGLAETTAFNEETFNAIFAPTGMVLLLVMGIGPLISWRRATAKNFRKNFVKPLAWASVITVVVGALWIVLDTMAMADAYALSFGDAYMAWASTLDYGDYFSYIVYFLCAFVLASVVREFWLAARVRKRKFGGGYLGGLVALSAKNPRRYGGYLVHVGVVFMFIAFTGKAFKTEERDRLVTLGNTHIVEEYSLTLADRDRYWSEGEGAIIQEAAFVVLPLRGTVASAELDDLVGWLERRDVGVFHVETEVDSPKMRVRFQDEAERARLMDDFVLARDLAGDFQRVSSDRSARVMTFTPNDANLAQAMPFAAMEQLRGVRDSLAMGGFGATPAIAGGSLALTVRFDDLAAYDAFDRRFARVTLGGAIGGDLRLDDEDAAALTRVYELEDPALWPIFVDAVAASQAGATVVGGARDASHLTLRFEDRAAYDGFATTLSDAAIPAAILNVLDRPELGAVEVIDRRTGVVLRPESRFYPVQGSATTEVAISGADFFEDVYISMQAAEDPSLIKLYTVIFPLVNFLWIGGMLLLFGSVVCLIPPWLGRTIIAVVQPRRGAAGPAAGLVLGLGVASLLALHGGAAHAAVPPPEPFGFGAPSGPADQDLLSVLRCACDEGRQLRSTDVRLSDPACDCPSAEQDRRVVRELLAQSPPEEQRSGRAKYDVLLALVGVDPRWDGRFVFDEQAYHHLVHTTKNTCDGERGMTLAASKSTCSIKSTWLPRFRALLTAGVGVDDIFEYYVLENNVTQNPSKPWELHELRTMEDTRAGYGVPIALVSAAGLLLIGLFVFRRRRAGAAAAASRETRGMDTALDDRDRRLLAEELEEYEV